MCKAKGYGDLMSEKYLKESIITQSQALYGANYSNAHNWSVVVEEFKPARGPKRCRKPTYRAHVIMYTSSRQLSKWMPLESTTRPQATEKEALGSLLVDLQEGLARLFKRDYTYDSGSETAIESDEEPRATSEKNDAEYKEDGDDEYVDAGKLSAEYLVDAEYNENAEAEAIKSFRRGDDEDCTEESEYDPADSDDAMTAEEAQQAEEESNDDEDADGPGEGLHKGKAAWVPSKEGTTVIEERNRGSEQGSVENPTMKRGRNIGKERRARRANGSDEAELCLMHRIRKRSTDGDQVEDLVHGSDNEPPTKRVRVVKRRGYGGS